MIFATGCTIISFLLIFLQMYRYLNINPRSSFITHMVMLSSIMILTLLWIGSYNILEEMR